MIDCVVSPVDHTLSVADDEVKTTEPPEQKVVAPLAVIVGTEGNAFTVIPIGEETAEHKPLSTVTEYEPEAKTVIDCVVSPVDQMLSVVDEDVKITDPPEQNVVGPLAEMVGVAGVGFTVTVSAIEFPEEQPFSMTSTVKFPEAVTVIDCVVSPVDHKLSVAEDEVKTTEPPEQKVVTPLAVIVGTEGSVFTVIPIGEETAEHKPLSTVTE